MLVPLARSRMRLVGQLYYILEIPVTAARADGSFTSVSALSVTTATTILWHNQSVCSDKTKKAMFAKNIPVVFSWVFKSCILEFCMLWSDFAQNEKD